MARCCVLIGGAFIGLVVVFFPGSGGAAWHFPLYTSRYPMLANAQGFSRKSLHVIIDKLASHSLDTKTESLSLFHQEESCSHCKCDEGRCLRELWLCEVDVCDCAQ